MRDMTVQGSDSPDQKILNWNIQQISVEITAIKNFNMGIQTSILKHFYWRTEKNREYIFIYFIFNGPSRDTSRTIWDAGFANGSIFSFLANFLASSSTSFAELTLGTWASVNREIKIKNINEWQLHNQMNFLRSSVQGCI